MARVAVAVGGALVDVGGTTVGVGGAIVAVGGTRVGVRAGVEVILAVRVGSGVIVLTLVGVAVGVQTDVTVSLDPGVLVTIAVAVAFTTIGAVGTAVLVAVATPSYISPRNRGTARMLAIPRQYMPDIATKTTARTAFNAFDRAMFWRYHLHIVQPAFPATVHASTITRARPAPCLFPRLT